LWKIKQQTDSQTLKERKKKSPVQEQYNYILSSSGVTLLASSPVFPCLLGRFGAGVWWCWRSLVSGSKWAGAQCGGRPAGQWPGRAVVQWSCGVGAWRGRGLVGLLEGLQSRGLAECRLGGPAGWRLGTPSGWWPRGVLIWWACRAGAW
jgi:hypothetical protein